MAKKVTQKDLDKLVKDKIKLIETGPANFYSSVEEEQKKILKQTIELIGELDTKDGIIQPTQRNLDLIDSIDKKLKKSFYKSDYISAASDLIGQLDEVKNLTSEYFKAGFGTFDNKKADLFYQQNRKTFLESLISTTSTDQALFKPVGTNILNAITNGTPFTDLVSQIKTTVTGDDKVDGQLQKYAKQIAGDSFSATERNYTKTIALSLDIQFYKYVGGELPDTRCFCEERNGNTYHIEEIKSWGRMENLGDCNIGGGWAGMIKGTNESNIMTFLGGYNCKHSLIPISLALVPMAVIERAISEGWFVPTEAEKELLGLN